LCAVVCVRMVILTLVQRMLMMLKKWTLVIMCFVNKLTFYPNVTTLHSVICYCKSVCRLSVTFVHRTQRVEAISNISLPLFTLSILCPPCKTLWRSFHRNLFTAGINPFSPVLRHIYTSVHYLGRRTYTSWHHWFN